MTQPADHAAGRLPLNEPASARRPDPPRGQGPKLVFSCPECGTDGWIGWNNLPRGMRCPACGVRFWLAQDGQLRSERSVAKIRFACPRCGQKDEVPAELTARGVRCAACGARLRIGRDGKFHDKEQHATPSRETPAPARAAATTSARVGRMAAKLWRVAVAVCLAGAATYVAARGLGYHVGPSGGQSLDGSVLEFTQSCLSGDAESAARWALPEQSEAFRRWYAIAYAVKPTDSRRKDASARITIRQQERNANRAVMRLTIAAAGTILQTQHWQLRDGRWRFDPQATMRAWNCEH